MPRVTNASRSEVSLDRAKQTAALAPAADETATQAGSVRVLSAGRQDVGSKLQVTLALQAQRQVVSERHVLRHDTQKRKGNHGTGTGTVSINEKV